MTERERYQKRRTYFVEYAKANRAKRREANRRWVAKRKGAVIAAAQPIVIPRQIEGIAARFAAYRAEKLRRVA